MPNAYIDKILNARVYDVARETPLTQAPRLSARLGNRLWFKREDLQPIFSFKLRGAYNKIVQLPQEVASRGVITASAGNHSGGRGVFRWGRIFSKMLKEGIEVFTWGQKSNLQTNNESDLNCHQIAINFHKN